jgi:hypothetical protein
MVKNNELDRGALFNHYARDVMSWLERNNASWAIMGASWVCILLWRLRHRACERRYD